MSDTLFLLRLEHGNLGRLLGLIEHQTAAADAGQPVDRELLNLASEYISDFPDRCHHPKEDIVYRRLAERDPAACAGLRDLVAEHGRLHDLTESFARAVRRIPPGAAPVEPGIRDVMHEFTRRYRAHMRDEDLHFFPLAAERLTQDDWDALDFAVFERDDPLFDHATEERFSGLRERIDALAQDRQARVAVMEAAKELGRLTGIDSFNESMRRAGQPFRLARFAQGGFGLENDRKLLLHIPECSDARAAWCASCYLSGQGWPWKKEPSVG